MSEQIEELDAVEVDRFCAPSFCLDLPQYQELFDQSEAVDTSQCKARMLDALQADLLFLRNTKQSDPIQLEVDDRSIQLHRFPNKLAEVKQLVLQIERSDR